jgi:hypothetical protein
MIDKMDFAGFSNFEYLSRGQLCPLTVHTNSSIFRTPLSIRQLEGDVDSQTKRQTSLTASLLKIKRNLIKRTINDDGIGSAGSSSSSNSDNSVDGGVAELLGSSSFEMSNTSDSSSATMIIRKSPFCSIQLNVTNDDTELELSSFKNRRPSQCNYENQIMSPIHAVRPPPPVPIHIPKPIMTSSRSDLVHNPSHSPLAFTNNTYDIAFDEPAGDELDQFVQLNSNRFERIKTKRKLNSTHLPSGQWRCCNICLV